MCVMFLLMIGQEVSYGGWVASYAVMSKYSTKERATIYSSIYYMAITAFRFIFAFIPGSGKCKLISMYLMSIASVVLSLVLIHHFDPHFGLVLGSFLLGMADSITFPQTLTLSQQYDRKVTPSMNSSFFLCASVGEGTLAMFFGLFLSINADMLFYGIMLISSILLALLLITIRSLEQRT